MAKPTKHILLLGGTGAMGVYLAPELLRLGYKVDITSRSQHRDKPGLHYIQGDAHDKKFLRRILKQKYDAIVDFMIYNTKEFQDRYKLFLENTEQYMLLSSATALAEKPSPITEKTPRLLDILPDDNEFKKSDEYAITKARQEDILRGSGRKNWTILRPNITYSKERLQLVNMEVDTLMFRALQDLPVVVPREVMDKQTTMTWGGDVAKLIALLIGNKKALGEDFNLVTAEHHTWREVAEYYKELIGLKWVEIDLDTYINTIGGWNQMHYHRMFNLVYDNKKVLDATGFKQDGFKKLKDGLRQETEYFSKYPRYFRHEYMWELNGNTDRVLKTKIDLSNTEKYQRKIYYKFRYPRLYQMHKDIMDKLRIIKHKTRIRTRIKILLRRKNV